MDGQTDGWNQLVRGALPPSTGISEPVEPFCNPKESFPPARAVSAL